MNDLKHMRRSEDEFPRTSTNAAMGWAFACGMGWMFALMVVVEGVLK